MDAAIERIRNAPTSYPKIKKDYRQVIMRRFPYAIYYEFEDGTITVYTVFHCSRDPDKLDELLP